MNSRPFSRKSPRNTTAGFSLIELLVTLLLVSLMMTVMTGFFRASVGTRFDIGLQTEAQQGLRATLEVITQELRQAGACLPTIGQFIALDGENNTNRDKLTLRIGQTDPDTLVCIKTGTTVEAEDGSTTLTVPDGDGDLFGDTNLVYITPDGASGEYYVIDSTTATTITLTAGVDDDLPVGTGIYAVDERSYKTKKVNGERSLVVQIDGDSEWQPLVSGVRQLNIQYHLAPCPPCTPIDLPQDDTEWRLVREVSIFAKVRSQKEDRQDKAYIRESGEVTVKPRNLI